ncbi:senescence associated gene 20-like [Abrus precatorius]|uniref:Senescence associated gene 20-like n=1 Tax=Abrus precatorius TaxID=3816 RepID=A0A8B8MKN3_ABRPR|nr:senescence associated gene 20-like [Abrus precatorius]
MNPDPKSYRISTRGSLLPTNLILDRQLYKNTSRTCLEELEDQESRNQRVVTDLYKAIVSKDTDTMYRLLAPYLEWWFHGPPSHRHHLIPLLTGSSSSSPSSKPLVPDLVVGFGSVIIAEGYDDTNMLWWVHVWTTSVDGIITEVREYVNTSVTVTRLGLHAQASSQKLGSTDVVAASTCQSIWQSKLCDESVPGLILAI